MHVSGVLLLEALSDSSTESMHKDLGMSNNISNCVMMLNNESLVILDQQGFSSLSKSDEQPTGTSDAHQLQLLQHQQRWGVVIKVNCSYDAVDFGDCME
jgi:hypothetical protein